jgi:WD40 repeat protein
LLACVLSTRAWAQGTAEPPLPVPGLPLEWRLEQRALPAEQFASSIVSFSPDGRLIAHYSMHELSILDAATGRVLRTSPAAEGPVYAIAVSSVGQVALGRFGELELFGRGPRDISTRHDCQDRCGPVTSVAFSGDGSLLAYQDVRTAVERSTAGTKGWLNIVEAASGLDVIKLESTANRAQVMFLPERDALLATAITRVDGAESYGLKIWRTGGWTLLRSLRGLGMDSRAIGRIGAFEYGAVFERDGRLELRDLGTSTLRWSVPLLGPDYRDEAGDGVVRLDHVAIAPDGRFIVSYEAPPARVAPEISDGSRGALVIRNAEGVVEAAYDIPYLASFAIAPDSRSFVFSVGLGKTYTALARVPF